MFEDRPQNPQLAIAVAGHGRFQSSTRVSDTEEWKQENNILSINVKKKENSSACNTEETHLTLWVL